MKRTLMVLLAVLVLAMAIPTSAAAKLVSFGSGASGNPGASVTVSINVDNLNQIAGYNIDFTYDSTVLTATGAAVGSAFAGYIFVANLATAGQVRLGMAGITGNASTAAGQLATVTFTVNATAYKNSALTFTRTDLKDESGQNIAGTTTANGSVAVTGVTITVAVTPASTTNVVAGQPVTLTAEVLVNGTHFDLTNTSDVTFATSGNGIFGPKSLTGGEVQVEYTMSAPESATITATERLTGHDGFGTAYVTVNPGAPASLALAPDDDSGEKQDDRLTKIMSGLTITGTGKEGATVHLYDSGIEMPGATRIISGGTFSIDISLEEGFHRITAKQTDTAGNTSMASDILEISVDITQPVTTATPPAGTYNPPITLVVNLTCNDGAGGCKVYYTLDGSEPTTSSPIYTSPILITEDAVLKFFSVDNAGNREMIQTQFYNFVDTSTPGTPSIVINADEGFTSSQSVVLTLGATDNVGVSGYYVSESSYGPALEDFVKVSGGTIFQLNVAFTLSAGDGNKMVFVWFRDEKGNMSSAVSDSIVLDTNPPLANIKTPLHDSVVSQIFKIEAGVSDVLSGISKVEFQITDGTWYLTGEAGSRYFVEMESWISAVKSGDSWVCYTSDVSWLPNTMYTIKTRMTDLVGNVSVSGIRVTYLQPGVKWTELSLDTSSQTILQGETIDTAGRLTSLPGGVALKGLTIKLAITPPEGSLQQPWTETTTTYDDYGHYRFENIAGFTQKGLYTLKATFDGVPGSLNSANSYWKSLLVGSQAGYAIIVQGKIPNEEGLGSHNKTANRIYNKLKDRSFVDENIYYFNFNTQQQNVDETPQKSRIQWAVETWAYDRMHSSPAPLFLVFVDHGNRDRFYIGNETIAPSDLAEWLNTLEAKLGSNWAEKRIVIIGSCFSGSFIPSLSKSGRIIVTSASKDEESYKGPQEPDGIRSGEFFLEEFFQQLWRGFSLKRSFDEATKQTEVFTRGGAGSPNANLPPFFDRAVQHPLLDDNGDKVGSNELSGGIGDGQISGETYLGTGITYNVNSLANPAEIIEATETLYLGSTENSATLWARTNGEESVAWVEIRPPSKTLYSLGGTEQLEIDLEKEFMVFNQGVSPARWERDYSDFSTSGMYEVFYFLRDAQSDEISPMKRSLVYKGKEGNAPPSSFGLLSPVNGNQEKTVLLLDWQDAQDSDGPVTYNLVISKDSAFNQVVFTREEIPVSMTYIDESVGLVDQTWYYWRIDAVDRYGARTSSNEVWSFKTNNTNVFPGFISGVVYDGLRNNPLDGANIRVDLGSMTALSFGGGYFLMSVPGATVSIYSKCPGYQDVTLPGVKVNEGAVTKLNIMMLPIQATLDLEPPSASASLADGKYYGPQKIILSCEDAGSGCAAIYYTTDGSEPTIYSSIYNGPVPIPVSTQLKFFSKDLSGNSGAVKTQSYEIWPGKGNVNGDQYLNLADAILGLRILVKLEAASEVPMEADVNGDGKIGMEEVIYIIQRIAGMRNQ